MGEAAGQVEVRLWRAEAGGEHCGRSIGGSMGTAQEEAACTGN